MGVYSNTSGLAKAKGPAKIRNRHLIPESTTRGKRILDSAVEEEVSALEWYSTTAEYWIKLTSGRLCSCQDKTVEVEIEEREKDGGLSLRDFIMTNDLSLPARDFCPICFGNKYVGGYSRFGVDTIVLDATAKPRASSTIELVKELPHWYRPTNQTGSVTWNFFVPKYFDSLGDIAIRWHEKPTTWSIKIDGSPFSRSLLDSSKGNKIALTIDMKDSTNKNAGVYAIFLQFIVKDPNIRIDAPRQTISYGSGDWGTLDSVQGEQTINVDRQIEHPHTSDLIVDSNGILWRPIEIEKGNPFGKTIFNTMQCRKVQPFELYYIVPSLAVSRIYNKNTNLTFIE